MSLHGRVARPEGPILALRGITKRFVERPDVAERIANALGAHHAARTVHAVDGVELAIQQGEVVGLVGESGCGKTTLGRIAVGLTEPTTGERHWQGRPADFSDPATRLAIQMIFQDAYASLNPRLRVGDIIGEAPLIHGIVSRANQSDYVAELMRQVGLDPSYARRYPHQFSGGQRARIGIARALAVKPTFLVCDEAVAALDVSIAAQVLNLFIALRESHGLTYLFISHDLGVVRHLSDRIVIMYLGRVVETAPTETLFAAPHHPYTQALLAEVPSLAVRKRSYVAIRGEIPSPLAPPTGCHFHPRCPHAMPRCKIERPALKSLDDTHASACFLDP